MRDDSCSAQNTRVLRNPAGRPATYSALPPVPSANSSQSVKLCSESALKYPPSFCGSKPPVQVAQETESKMRRKLRWLLNTPRIFEGIAAKHVEVLPPKSKQTRSLSHFEELQQCEVCSCTLFFLGSNTNNS
jgi:hypothetical protein